MNILFIHEVDWLKKVVFDIHNLAEILSVRGHNVYAIDYENTWEKNGFWDFGSLKTKGLESKERAISGSSITLRRPGIVKIPGISRLSAGFTHNIEIKKVIKENKIDIIMLYSVPTNGIQTVRIAKKLGVPVVFRSIDMLHGLVHNPVLRSVTKYLEKKVYSSVDIILAITPNHSRYVAEMGANEAKVKLLPLPIDTDLFRPGVNHSELKKKWGFTDEDKIIVFIGTLFEFSGLNGFIREFPRVVKTIPETKLLIVGDGLQRNKLEKIIDELNLRKYITITGFQPYQTMPQYINLATLCINTFLNTPSTHDIFPGKIIQYIACGKVAVVTPLLGITSLIPDETKGIIYTGNAQEMAEKIIELLIHDDQRRKLEQAGLDYIKQVHDQSKIGEQLEAELWRIKESYNKRSN